MQRWYLRPWNWMRSSRVSEWKEKSKGMCVGVEGEWRRQQEHSGWWEKNQEGGLKPVKRVFPREGDGQLYQMLMGQHEDRDVTTRLSNMEAISDLNRAVWVNNGGKA